MKNHGRVCPSEEFTHLHHQAHVLPGNGTPPGQGHQVHDVAGRPCWNFRTVAPTSRPNPHSSGPAYPDLTLSPTRSGAGRPAHSPTARQWRSGSVVARAHTRNHWVLPLLEDSAGPLGACAVRAATPAGRRTLTWGEGGLNGFPGRPSPALSRWELLSSCPRKL